MEWCILWYKNVGHNYTTEPQDHMVYVNEPQDQYIYSYTLPNANYQQQFASKLKFQRIQTSLYDTGPVWYFKEMTLNESFKIESAKNSDLTLSSVIFKFIYLFWN